MTNNGLELTRLASHAWSANLPVSWVLAKAIELEIYQPFIRRFVETVDDTEQIWFDMWCGGIIQEGEIKEFTQ